ncbi:MAG: hypothetical protein HY692_01195, partial [Cyanobacteria bacterium NC_groundwater_1444_Ag_S-0.65um_54_12]|nr:hypothetical protein [Cyanobacteria bacterium NC_groundwater_1444_Ag_S-0.65um_54_12]
MESELVRTIAMGAFSFAVLTLAMFPEPPAQAQFALPPLANQADRLIFQRIVAQLPRV